MTLQWNGQYSESSAQNTAITHVDWLNMEHFCLCFIHLPYNKCLFQIEYLQIGQIAETKASA